MIKRFPTRCGFCGHANTLRVTLGINARQRHAFECQGCGEEAYIELEIDFINRESFGVPGFEGLTFPKVTDVKLQNAERTDEEGTITNLDPTFLVPEEELHSDGVFSWMHALKDVVKKAENGGPKFRDVVDEAGMPRGIREGIAVTLKALELNTRGRSDLAKVRLKELTAISGVEVQSVSQAIAMVATAILGKAAATDVRRITALAQKAFDLDQGEFRRMRDALMNELAKDFLERQLAVLKEYLRGYDQFSQAWFYAANELPVTEQFQPSGRGLDVVRHFYGTAFEQLSSGLVLPACINNILGGREFDQFEAMDLKRYLTTDKAGRARCLEGRAEFSGLWSEFDSTLRNGSYHQGLRLKPTSKYVIQYRTGDTKVWQEIKYSNFLARCNNIMICSMKLLALQMFVFGSSAFERT